MCEVWPGPRCNDKCQTRDIKKELFHQIAKVHGKGTPEYNNAMSELLESQKVYDTTPRGIKELEELIVNKPNDPLNRINFSRFVQGKSIRMMQSEALKEIQNGRVPALARIISALDGTFSPEEMETIIAASRENREIAVTNDIYLRKNPNDLTIEAAEDLVNQINSKSGEDYYEYVAKISKSINATYGRNVSQQLINDSQLLDSLEPPSQTNLHAYRSIGNAINKAKEQTRDELMRIAAIQDASPAIIAEYFDAYRQQYKEKYSHLPQKEQPNPPREWIEGSLPKSGLTKNDTTFFVPRDPATLYAIYKLRTDLNAVPDYLKQSSKISAIDKTLDGFTVTHISRTGKHIKQESYPYDELVNIIKRDSKDAVIIIDEPNKQILDVANPNKIIFLKDIAKKHFNTTSETVPLLATELKTKESVLDVYGAMRKKILKTWATKSLRTETTNLDFTPKNESRSIKLVR